MGNAEEKVKEYNEKVTLYMAGDIEGKISKNGQN